MGRLPTWPPCWADSAPMPTACFMVTPSPLVQDTMVAGLQQHLATEDGW